jgi:hypothetical protein
LGLLMVLYRHLANNLKIAERNTIVEKTYKILVDSVLDDTCLQCLSSAPPDPAELHT